MDKTEILIQKLTQSFEALIDAQADIDEFVYKNTKHDLAHAIDMITYLQRSVSSKNSLKR